MFRQLRKIFFPAAVSNTAPAPEVRERAAMLKNQGDAAMAQSDLHLAEKCYREAMLIHPDFAEACNNLGVVLYRSERFGEAVECYLKALEINPAHAPAWMNLGNWHETHGNTEDRVRHYQKAIEVKPDYLEAHINLGAAFLKQGKLESAIACFHTALSIERDFPLALLNLGLCHRAKADKDGEITFFSKAVAVKPDSWEAHNQLGHTYHAMGEFAKAEEHFRTSIKLNPEGATAKFNLGILELQKGNYVDGLALYEARFDVYKIDNPHYDGDYYLNACRAPRWAGEDLQGKTILIWQEQGLGDNLMMMRFLPQLIGRGLGRLVILSRPPLSRIFSHLPYATEVIESEAELLGGRYDYHCPLTSLPYLLGCVLDTIPCEVPYVFVPSDMAQRWNDRVSAMRGLKVGLVWAGNKKLSRDALRSVPLSVFQPLSAIPGITYISLQKGESAGEAQDAAWLVRDCISDCNDFLDTAALVASLDLVISVDTSTAHLAGALGTPVWLLNRFESEWRWMIGRENSPWYPSMKIFRQPALHDWESVIDNIAGELNALRFGSTAMECAA